MTFTRLWKSIIVAAGLLVLIGLYDETDALAEKKASPPPPPVPPGAIYYRATSGASWSMKGDGSGKVQSIGGTPSYQKHGSSRWFLQNRFIDNTGLEQWFAVDQAGAAVQMTNGPELHWNGHPPVWAKDDSFFSFTALDSTEDEWIGRLMVVEIAWIDGRPVAGPPTVGFESRRPFWYPTPETLGYDEVDFGSHDWSPAGDEVALTHWVWEEGQVLDIAHFSDGEVAWRRLAAQAENPAWSLDGGRIAFNRVRYSGYQEIRDIRSIKPDGTAVVQLTTYISGKGSNGTAQLLPTWSPDGAYLAYAERVINGNKTTHNILRISAGGGSPTRLTTDGTSSLPRWRP